MGAGVAGSNAAQVAAAAAAGIGNPLLTTGQEVYSIRGTYKVSASTEAFLEIVDGERNLGGVDADVSYVTIGGSMATPYGRVTLAYTSDNEQGDEYDGLSFSWTCM